MENVFLIGGGEIAREARDSETYELDRQILKAIPSEKLEAPVVFIGAAAGDAPGYFETFRDYYTDLRLEVGLPTVGIINLEASASATEFRDTVLKAGLVYLGGGETKLLLDALRAWQAESVLREGLASGVVLAGISAGAYALARKSVHIDRDDIEVNDGLGLVSVVCQAHATPETTAKAEGYLAEHSEGLEFLPLAEGQMRGFKVS